MAPAFVNTTLDWHTHSGVKKFDEALKRLHKPPVRRTSIVNRALLLSIVFASACSAGDSGCSSEGPIDMDIAPLTLDPMEDGRFQLQLAAGFNPSDQTVFRLGHEPNGEFWVGIAELYVRESVQELEGDIEYDPEAGGFFAYAENRDALTRLGQLMAKAAMEPGELRAAFARAEQAGIEFWD